VNYTASGETRHDLALAEARETLLDPVEGVLLNRGRRADVATLLVFVTDSGRTDADLFQSALEQQLQLLNSSIDRFVITAGNPSAIAVQSIAYFNGVDSIQPAGTPSRVLVAGDNFSTPIVDSIIAHACNPCPFGEFVATTCSATTDNTCAAHSVTCDHLSRVGELFQLSPPTTTTDRQVRCIPDSLASFLTRSICGSTLFRR
jgi:hypothetical protein